MVINNTFSRNSHDGISITGNSKSIIRSNYFYQNGANGMTIYGTSGLRCERMCLKKDLASILPKGCAGASWQSHYQEQVASSLKPMPTAFARQCD